MDLRYALFPSLLSLPPLFARLMVSLPLTWAYLHYDIGEFANFSGPVADAAQKPGQSLVLRLR